MADLVSLVVRLITDARDFKRGMKTANAGVANFTKSITKAQAAFAALGGALAITVAKDVFRIGAAAEETQSKFATVFGSASDEVERFSANFGRVAGLSKGQAQEITATTGSIVQGLGFARAESARFSQQLLKLSGDLASFNNRDTAEVSRAIAAALTGEREQIKRLGLEIREADVQQRALALSAKESAAALTDQEKAMATLTLLQERSGVAVGDLARTSKSAANQARQLGGNIQSLKEEISRGLLPVLTPLVRGLNSVTAAAVQSARGVNRIIEGIRGAFSGQAGAEEDIARIARSVQTLEQAQVSVDAATGVYLQRLQDVRKIQDQITTKTGEARKEILEAARRTRTGLGVQLEEATTRAEEASIALKAYRKALADLEPLDIRGDDVQGEVGPVASALQTLRTALRQTGREFAVFGDSNDAFRGRVAAYRTAISELLQTLEPTHPEVRRLVAEFQAATHQTDLMADATGRLRADLQAIGAAGAQAVAGLSTFTRGATTSALQQLEAALASARQQFRLFGDSETLRTDQIEAYRAAIVALTASEGENSAAVQRLLGNYRALANEARSLREELGAQFTDFALAFGDTFGNALTQGKQAFRDFANFAIAEITRIIARFAIFKALTAVFGGSAPGSFGAGVLGALGAGQNIATPQIASASQTTLDFSNFPAASNPLASARDGEWIQFLDRSLNHRRASGFRDEG